jgi:hypothetical protein
MHPMDASGGRRTRARSARCQRLSSQVEMDEEEAVALDGVGGLVGAALRHGSSGAGAVQRLWKLCGGPQRRSQCGGNGHHGG